MKSVGIDEGSSEWRGVEISIVSFGFVEESRQIHHAVFDSENFDRVFGPAIEQEVTRVTIESFALCNAFSASIQIVKVIAHKL